MQSRPERVDERRLGRRPGDVHPISHAMAAQPGFEHEGDLVEGSGALVAGRHQEEHVEVLAAVGPLA
jgi:hypothetical protein